MNLLLKLGGLYGDKLNDDRGAVRAFKRLLELRPDERRAQEQLKKRYAALRDWDALEDFYATTDKWDELIRVFEREGDDANVAIEERISLLKRVARLWAEKKDKADRAARSYEKILELDADNLDAAVALSPIYEQGKDAKKLASVYEVRLKHVEDAGRAPHAAARDRPDLRGDASRIRARRSPSSWRRSRSRPRARSRVKTSLVWQAKSRAAGTSSPTAYEQAIDGATDPLEITDLRLRPVPCSRRSAASTKPSSSWPTSTTPSPTTCGRLRHSSPCTGRPAASRTCSRSIASARSSRTTREVRKQLAYHIARSRRTSSRSRPKPSIATRRSSPTGATTRSTPTARSSA